MTIYKKGPLGCPGTQGITEKAIVLCCSLSAGYLCGRPRGESNVWPTKQDYQAFAAERCGQNWNRVFTFFRSK